MAENITFRNIQVGTGHGITIGSDMSAGVRNVTFENITMDGTGMISVRLCTAVLVARSRCSC